MSFRLFTSPTGQRSLQKLSPPIRQHLKSEILQLADNPLRGKPLESSQRFLRSLRVVYRGTHYRVAYQVNAREKEIIVHLVGSRENFYKALHHLRPKRLA